MVESWCWRMGGSGSSQSEDNAPIILPQKNHQINCDKFWGYKRKEGHVLESARSVFVSEYICICFIFVHSAVSKRGRFLCKWCWFRLPLISPSQPFLHPSLPQINFIQMLPAPCSPTQLHVYAQHVLAFGFVFAFVSVQYDSIQITFSVHMVTLMSSKFSDYCFSVYLLSIKGLSHIYLFALYF